jgi:hypothetical protein
LSAKSKANEIKDGITGITKTLVSNDGILKRDTKLTSAKFRFAITYIKDSTILQEFIGSIKHYYAAATRVDTSEAKNIKELKNNSAYEIDATTNKLKVKLAIPATNAAAAAVKKEKTCDTFVKYQLTREEITAKKITKEKYDTIIRDAAEINMTKEEIDECLSKNKIITE